jgi:hypothetical protein
LGGTCDDHGLGPACEVEGDVFTEMLDDDGDPLGWVPLKNPIIPPTSKTCDETTDDDKEVPLLTQHPQ